MRRPVSRHARRRDGGRVEATEPPPACRSATGSSCLIACTVRRGSPKLARARSGTATPTRCWSCFKHGTEDVIWIPVDLDAGSKCPGLRSRWRRSDGCGRRRKRCVSPRERAMRNRRSRRSRVPAAVRAPPRRWRRDLDRSDRVVAREKVPALELADRWYPGRPLLRTRTTTSSACTTATTGVDRRSPWRGPRRCRVRARRRGRHHTPGEARRHRDRVRDDDPQGQGSQFETPPCCCPSPTRALSPRAALHGAATRARTQLVLPYRRGGAHSCAATSAARVRPGSRLWGGLTASGGRPVPRPGRPPGRGVDSGE